MKAEDGKRDDGVSEDQRGADAIWASARRTHEGEGKEGDGGGMRQGGMGKVRGVLGKGGMGQRHTLHRGAPRRGGEDGPEGKATRRRDVQRQEVRKRGGGSSEELRMKNEE